MFNLQEILKFRDSVQFRAVVNLIADRITNIPWVITPDDTAVERAIAYPNPDMAYPSFIRRTLLDMLALNFGTFEVAVTERDKFVLMQCFPAELFPVKDWTREEPPTKFRWVYHDKRSGIDTYLSDQKIAIFPSYGNFDITHDQMWGLMSPIGQIMEVISIKLDVKAESQPYPRMDSLHIFNTSLSIQNALEVVADPEPGYASIWRSEFGIGKAITKLKSGIIVPNDPTILLKRGNEIEGYSKWIGEAILKVLLQIYSSLLKGTEEEQVVRQAIGGCGGYEDAIVAITIILGQGINRLMKNLDIDCKFSFCETPLLDRAVSELEQRAELVQLGYPPGLVAE